MNKNLQKGLIVSLFAVTPITLTGCSFEYLIPESEKQYIEQTATAIKDSFGVLSEIGSYAEALDGQDFTDDELENILNEMYETGNSLSDIISSENNMNVRFVSARVVRVVDGDTIVVEIDGQEEKVRLIGIDTPESVASQEYLDKTGKENTEAGKTASEYTKSLLTEGQTVYLEKDTSDTDRYGRLLRYVWIFVPNNKDDLTEIATKMLNGILIKDGYAEIATYPPDTYHKSDFEYIYEMSHSDGYYDEDYSVR